MLAQMLVVLVALSLAAGSIIAEQAVFARAALHRATLAASDSALRSAVSSLQVQLATAVAACGAQAADGSTACAALERPDLNIALQPLPAERDAFVIHTEIVPTITIAPCSSGAPTPGGTTPVAPSADARNIACSAFVNETRYSATIVAEVRAPDDLAVLQKRTAHATLRLTRQPPYAFLTGFKEDGAANPDFGIEGDIGGATAQTQIIVDYGCAGSQCAHAPGDPMTSVGVDGQRRAHFDWNNGNANASHWSN